MMAMRVARDNDGNGDSGKSDGNGNEGGGQVTATRAKAAAMTVVGNNEGDGDNNEGGRQTEGEGGKAMAAVTRVAGEQRRWQQRGQWCWQARCAVMLLVLVLPLPPPLVGKEDDSHSTNVKRSFAALAHACDGGNDDGYDSCRGQSWITHRIRLVLPSPPQAVVQWR
jgi:hypothetical protein